MPTTRRPVAAGTAAARSGARPVPNFTLYGSAEAAPAWAEVVHVERIPDRSRLHDWEIRPHTHDALIQLLVPATGTRVEAQIDGTAWVLAPPCVIVAPARSVHGFRFSEDTDGHVITAAQRPLEALAGAASPDLGEVLRRPAVMPLDDAGRLQASIGPLVAALEREAQTQGSGRVAAGLALLVALFVQVVRLQDARARDEPAEASGVVSAAAAGTGAAHARSRPARHVERFRALLDQRWRHHESVQGYADALGLTAGQLTRLCRQVLGVTALEVINARVVHEAQRELVYSSLSVKQVAAALGFADEAYFVRWFKRHTGERPTAFRETARRRLAG